ncbi:MAG: glycine cleavage system H protein [Verrucomicrobiales bacterium]|jgi:glycine cleavage system H protein
MNIPEDLLYTKDHEWVRVEGDRVRVGITDYAQDALGDVVFVELAELGGEVTMNEGMGEVESTKSVSDLYAPLSGTVVDVNSALASAPGAVNADPYGEGWLCVLEMTDEMQLKDLLDATAYGELTGE